MPGQSVGFKFCLGVSCTSLVNSSSRRRARTLLSPKSVRRAPSVTIVIRMVLGPVPLATFFTMLPPSLRQRQAAQLQRLQPPPLQHQAAQLQYLLRPPQLQRERLVWSCTGTSPHPQPGEPAAQHGSDGCKQFRAQVRAIAIRVYYAKAKANQMKSKTKRGQRGGSQVATRKTSRQAEPQHERKGTIKGQNNFDDAVWRHNRRSTAVFHCHENELNQVHCVPCTTSRTKSMLLCFYGAQFICQLAEPELCKRTSSTLRSKPLVRSSHS